MKTMTGVGPIVRFVRPAGLGENRSGGWLV